MTDDINDIEGTKIVIFFLDEEQTKMEWIHLTEININERTTQSIVNCVYEEWYCCHLYKNLKMYKESEFLLIYNT